MTDKESSLYTEEFDIEWELFNKLYTLIDAKWDSDTLKVEIESLVKQRSKILDEQRKLDEKENKEDN